MKMHIAFDMTDLDKAVSLALEVADYADAFEIGSLLLYKYGEHAIKEFKKNFPQKTLFVDSKIVDHGKETALLLAEAGADWMTVMAGTPPAIIRTVCATAHEKNKKVMLDLIDTRSVGQAALEAQSLGVDALLIHTAIHPEEEVFFLDKWEMAKGNTQLPLFISSHITHETFPELIKLSPAGIILGKAIVQAPHPAKEAQFFYSLINHS